MIQKLIIMITCKGLEYYLKNRKSSWQVQREHEEKVLVQAISILQRSNKKV